MHEKSVEVCVMMEDMSELLLDHTKENLDWNNSDLNLLNEKTIGSPEEVLKEQKMDSQHHDRVRGIKRIREESPISETYHCNGIDDIKTSNAKIRNKIILDTHSNSNREVAIAIEAALAPDSSLKNKNESDSFRDTSIENNIRLSENETEDTVSLEYRNIIGGHSVSSETPLHSTLRPSLFPKVPPFVKFSHFDVKGDPLPDRVRKILRWKLTSITPLVVRKVITNSGYRLLRKSTFWGGTWGPHPKSVGFKTLFEYQKMNHFPGTFQLGRKDRLWKSMLKLMTRHGKSKFDLMPTTYILPRDKKLLRNVWKKTEGTRPWIVKPPASSRGTGIKVVHQWKQIPENSPVIVQHYVSNPFLINDTKFDLRLYVLLTSVNPLRVYLYDNGLVRFASTKYSTELDTLSDQFVHLTNYSINRFNSVYEQNEDENVCQGHKWTLKTLWMYMEKELQLDVNKIWQRLTDLVVKTFISGEHTMSQLTNVNLQSRYNAYELFGIDVLLDVDLKPWLLEVNISPSLHSASPLDLAVKAPLVYDLMNIVGFHVSSSRKFTETDLCREMGNVPDNRLFIDNRIYTRTLSTEEKLKHRKFIHKTREEYLDTILMDLTPDDVRHLIQAEDELTQIGSFQKVFPTFESFEYLNYLETPRYYNFLFDAWETKYSANKIEGINILIDKCKEGVHLQVPNVQCSCLPNTCGTHENCARNLQNDTPFLENSTQ